MRSTAAYLITVLLSCYSCWTYTLEFIIEMLKYHLPAPVLLPFSVSSHFLSWSGVSKNAILKACNSCKAGEVPAFGTCIMFVVEQPKTRRLFTLMIKS